MMSAEAHDIEDDLDVRHEPWDQLTIESDAAFSYFRAYRNMERGSRSLRNVARQLDVPVGNLGTLSSKYQWVARVQAFDANLDAIEDAEFMATRRQIGRQLARTASAAAQAANQALAAGMRSLAVYAKPDVQGQEPGPILSAPDAIRAIRTASQVGTDVLKLVGLDRNPQLDLSALGVITAGASDDDDGPKGVEGLGIGMTVNDMAGAILMLTGGLDAVSGPLAAAAGPDDPIEVHLAGEDGSEADLPDLGLPPDEPAAGEVVEPPPLRGGPRLLIAGVPWSGKTTLANGYTPQARHTDDIAAAHGWPAVPERGAAWLNEPGPWVIEGVSVPKVLKTWLDAHPEGMPCDQVFWLGEPLTPPSDGQVTTGRAAFGLFESLVPDLHRRGVTVNYGLPVRNT